MEIIEGLVLIVAGGAITAVSAAIYAAVVRANIIEARRTQVEFDAK